MKRISIYISEETMTVAEELAARLGLTPDALLSLCLEGLTNPAHATGKSKAKPHGSSFRALKV